MLVPTSPPASTPPGFRSWAVARFAISGLVAVALLALGVFSVVHRQGRLTAIDHARSLTALAGNVVVLPHLTPALLAGSPAARARLDRAVRANVLTDSVVRVKLWSAAGRVLYSDEPRLVGRRYRLDADEAALLSHGGTHVAISDLRRPENRFERREGRLMEVYVPLATSSGRRVLYESYVRYSDVAAGGTRLWRSMAPAILGGLLLLWVVQAPMAAQLTRRLRRGQTERQALLQRAIEASALERRRIARDLHDGPVQRLTAVSYGLLSVSQDLRDDARGADAERVEDAAEQTRVAMQDLRAMLVELYPPPLQRAGLRAALGDLLSPLASRDIATHLHVDRAMALSVTDEALIFRIAQEALRNVTAHAAAHSVSVQLRANDAGSTLEVIDDGCGFGEQHEGTLERHFGLQMLADMARELGGRLTVRDTPGGGTTLRFEVPA